MKALLKKILPLHMLRWCFYYYNLAKKNMLDKLLFPEYKYKEDELKKYVKKNQYLNYGLGVKIYSDPLVQKRMDYWKNWEQEEYILDIRQECKVEPKQGWAFVKNNILLLSLGMGKEKHLSYPSFRKIYFGNYNIVKVERAISLRDTGEENYFHFYNDLLAKLIFLDSSGYNLKDFSIIISENLSQKAYFKFFLENFPLLKDLGWIIQKKHDLILCKRIVFCKPITHKFAIYQSIRKQINLDFLKVTTKSKKIFVTRKKTRLRHIENMKDLLPLLNDFGFEVIDADDLTLHNQIQLFSDAECIVGIHGAGLTNMIYCKNSSVKIVEILPPTYESYFPYHYLILSKMLNFEYKALVGELSNFNITGNFRIKPSKLKETLLDL